MDANLFYAVMEADGDLLEPFDPAAAEAEVADEQQGQPPDNPMQLYATPGFLFTTTFSF